MNSNRPFTRSQAARVMEDNRSEAMSIVSRSSAASSARLQALVDLETKKQSLEYEKIIAQKKKELADKQMELSVLAAEKEAAIAQAKVAVIDQIILEENDRDERHLKANPLDQISPSEDNRVPDRDIIDNTTIPFTQAWVNSTTEYSTHAGDQVYEDNHQPTTLFEVSSHHQQPPQPFMQPVLDIPVCGNWVQDPSRHSSQVHQTTQVTPARQCRNPWSSSGNGNPQNYASIPQQANGPTLPPTTKSLTNNSQSNSNEASAVLTTTHLANILARQNLPRFEPDIFTDDVSMYYPWKSSFQTMLFDTNIRPTQELTYLRKFTQGQSREIVDSISRRLYDEPKEAISDVWDALDRRFGNPAAITNAQLELLNKSANFRENDSAKLQAFSDVCLNVSSQMKRLPGLACLNYPNVLHPVITKLPRYLRLKWEKIVARYAESHADAYPDFQMFSDMIVQQSRLKNHPNIQMEQSSLESTHPGPGVCDGDTISYPPISDDYGTTADSTRDREVIPSYMDNSKSQYCPLHDCYGHDLSTCNLFEHKAMVDKAEILSNLGICSRCLKGEHEIDDCHADIQCSKCRSRDHCTRMHKDQIPEESSQVIQSTCTTVHSGASSNRSYSKIVLLDVYANDRPKTVRRIYALVDDQSNNTLIRPELVNDLELLGKEEKYTLSTCSDAKVVRSGRRIEGLVVQSVSGSRHILPSALECNNIPHDKREIVTPAVARTFPHLRSIANEIPRYNNTAQIMMLIGRDAPELVKVRAFKNGPAGAPWGQQLLLGWTISGQVSPTHNVSTDGGRQKSAHTTVTCHKVIARPVRCDKSAHTPPRHSTTSKTKQQTPEITPHIKARVPNSPMMNSSKTECSESSHGATSKWNCKLSHKRICEKGVQLPNVTTHTGAIDTCPRTKYFMDIS